MQALQSLYETMILTPTCRDKPLQNRLNNKFNKSSFRQAHVKIVIYEPEVQQKCSRKPELKGFLFYYVREFNRECLAVSFSVSQRLIVKSDKVFYVIAINLKCLK